MTKYILYCFMMSTMFCFSETTLENLDELKAGIELGQKVLDEKVERYNELLKKTYKQKQANERKTDDHAEAQDEKHEGTKQEEEPADHSELQQLSEEIEKEQKTLDKKVELYNQKLKWKADQTEESGQEDLVGLLRAEVQRLTNMVEHLQKDIRDLKKSSVDSIKGIITPEKNKVQTVFEEAWVEPKNNVRSDVKILEQSNNSMSPKQLDRYSTDSDCSSNMDRDQRKKQKTLALLQD